MDFGEKIKAIRLGENLNQRDFSDMTLIGIKTLQNYEQGLVTKYSAAFKFNELPIFQ